jgi:hypothetical protein
LVSTTVHLFTCTSSFVFYKYIYIYILFRKAQ